MRTSGLRGIVCMAAMLAASAAAAQGPPPTPPSTTPTTSQPAPAVAPAQGQAGQGQPAQGQPATPFATDQTYRTKDGTLYQPPAQRPASPAADTSHYGRT